MQMTNIESAVTFLMNQYGTIYIGGEKIIKVSNFFSYFAKTVYKDDVELNQLVNNNCKTAQKKHVEKGRLEFFLMAENFYRRAEVYIHLANENIYLLLHNIHSYVATIRILYDFLLISSNYAENDGDFTM